jgi:predicted MFS family arabinose efflux permease
VASSGGVLSEKIGWAQFFLLTSVLGLPALLLILWIGSRGGFNADSPKPAT